MTTYPTASALPDDLRPGLVDLLYRLADDSLIFGHRSSEWTGLGPILEEDIAFASMAQDKIGHALAYYNLLHDLGEGDPDTLAYARGPEAFRCCSLVSLSVADSKAVAPDLSNNPDRDRLLADGDWARSLVAQFLYSEADAVRLDALATSAYEPLGALARKLRGEVKYHTMHGRMLIHKLAASDESRGRMQGALDEVWPHALGLFEPTAYDMELAEKAICAHEIDLGGQWRSQVEPIIEQAGLTVPRDATPACGGRAGRHPPELARVLEAMTRVYRLDPAATW